MCSCGHKSSLSVSGRRRYSSQFSEYVSAGVCMSQSSTASCCHVLWPKEHACFWGAPPRGTWVGSGTRCTCLGRQGVRGVGWKGGACMHGTTQVASTTPALTYRRASCLYSPLFVTLHARHLARHCPINAKCLTGVRSSFASVSRTLSFPGSLRKGSDRPAIAKTDPFVATSTSASVDTRPHLDRLCQPPQPACLLFQVHRHHLHAPPPPRPFSQDPRPGNPA